MANHHKDNLTNCFMYCKKHSNIMLKNIDETIYRYKNNGNIGGCHVMGKVITDITGLIKMPIGDIMIGNEKSLILHEIGDFTLNNNSLEHFNSFNIFHGELKVMNPRFSSYHRDKNDYKNFININSKVI
jgi:hypothetical protein